MSEMIRWYATMCVSPRYESDVWLAVERALRLSQDLEAAPLVSVCRSEPGLAVETVVEVTEIQYLWGAWTWHEAVDPHAPAVIRISEDGREWSWWLYGQDPTPAPSLRAAMESAERALGSASKGEPFGPPAKEVGGGPAGSLNRARYCLDRASTAWDRSASQISALRGLAALSQVGEAAERQHQEEAEGPRDRLLEIVLCGWAYPEGAEGYDGPTVEVCDEEAQLGKTFCATHQQEFTRLTRERTRVPFVDKEEDQ